MCAGRDGASGSALRLEFADSSVYEISGIELRS
jgi:hypothetical protein